MSLGDPQGPIVGGPLGGSPDGTGQDDPASGRSGGGGARLLVLVLVVAAGVGGWFAAAALSDEVDDLTSSAADEQRSGIPGEPTDRVGPPVPDGGEGGSDEGESEPETTPDREPDFLRRDPIDDALLDLSRAIGKGYEAVSINVYDTYVIAQARDPATPSHVNRYVWRDGVVTGPDATIAPDPLEPSLWTPDRVQWERLPALTRDALDRFDLPDEEVSHVIVDRFLPFDDRIIIRVYVNEPGRGGGGYVQYTRTGDFVEVVG